METFIAFLIAALITLVFLRGYLKNLKRREKRAHQSAEKGKIFSEGPRSQHPHIDSTLCIGCGGCTSVCPEGDVLAMLGGKAAIINGYKCLGHSLCSEACPVGAITMVMASPSMAASVPYLTPQYETNIENLFIIGELGGLALIKNAVNQGRSCMDTITAKVRNTRRYESDAGLYDVVIVGAGPAGISASLRAIENNLKYITLEQDEVGGTIAKFPRQKVVMTSPVEFPLYGKFNKTELSKEHLLAFWDMILNRADFNVSTSEKLEDVKKGIDGMFTVETAHNQYRAVAVVLALGRSGTPRKLGVPGEDLPKVMYRLIEADHYMNKRVLVVGGGDSAVEAAVGLAFQPGNRVTLSYRRDSFSRLRPRNQQRIEDCMRKGTITVVFNSTPIEFRDGAVILDVNGQQREIANDFVWIFAGGTAPTELLRKIGIEFGTKDVTVEASAEARQAALEKKGLASSGVAT